MAFEASSIFCLRMGSPISKSAASFILRITSSSICIVLTIVPSCTSVNLIISEKGRPFAHS
uniref:Uncharacterized protein n=1 Tax=Lepeophtheirus salmonis TaxID=72036 RepID=A0A0K2VJ92_LEPSM